ncbi:SLC13 family permease [Pseudalkalibacillus salsuginis]|uniref:SLC13 family permease n=1 Tax=Pseudalkalibacillus salsuginis TaxID=2910972 RepID=UPI001F211347|nr:DASS family sodium-coupled anion symporter [Pseudalkalibacillus salsuginis]MCF6411599.1 DASS family sodium-coupled anion symporter [Pseudalkalibacillus salsuginis]
MKWLFVILGFVFVILSSQIPIQDDLGNEGWITLSIVFLSIVLWYTEVIDAAVTSLLVIVLFPLFHVISFEEAAMGLGNEVIWLLLAMLIMATAVKRTNLDKRLAFFMLSLSKGKVIFILFHYILMGFLLTFIIPNAIGRLAVLLPIAISLVKAFENQLDKNFSKSLILIVTFVPYISTTSILTGAGGSIYSASLFESMLDYEWSYLHWLIIMAPINMFTLLIFWALLLWLFPIKTIKLEDMNEYINQEIKKLGPMSKQEMKLIGLYSLLIMLWITKELHQIPLAMSAVMVSVLLFVPGMNIIFWKEARKDVNWGVPLLFAAGLTIAFSLKASGVIQWSSEILESNLLHLAPVTLPLMMMILFVLIRIVFTNFTAAAASLMPVALTVAIGSPFNPVWLGMICVVASSTSYLFPSQSAGNMTTYSLGYYSGRDMLILGLTLTLVIMAMTLLAAFTYWPYLGIPKI